MQGQSQSRRAAAEQAACNQHVTHQPAYLTLAEVAALLRFDVEAARPLEACRQWLMREAVPMIRVGRRIRIERRVLEAVLRK